MEEFRDPIPRSATQGFVDRGALGAIQNKTRIEFVSENPGAIGYVSASASLGGGVKALAVSE